MRWGSDTDLGLLTVSGHGIFQTDFIETHKEIFAHVNIIFYLVELLYLCTSEMCNILYWFNRFKLNVKMVHFHSFFLYLFNYIVFKCYFPTSDFLGTDRFV